MSDLPYESEVMAIVGSRDFTDEALMRQWISLRMPRQIISGGARGADSLARELADDFHIPFHEFPADWRRHGKAAGFIRNSEMVMHATEVAAFYSGPKDTPGTADFVRRAQALNLPIVILRQGTH